MTSQKDALVGTHKEAPKRKLFGEPVHEVAEIKENGCSIIRCDKKHKHVWKMTAICTNCSQTHPHSGLPVIAISTDNVSTTETFSHKKSKLIDSKVEPILIGGTVESKDVASDSMQKDIEILKRKQEEIQEKLSLKSLE